MWHAGLIKISSSCLPQFSTSPINMINEIIHQASSEAKCFQLNDGLTKCSPNSAQSDFQNTAKRRREWEFYSLYIIFSFNSLAMLHLQSYTCRLNISMVLIWPLVIIRITLTLQYIQYNRKSVILIKYQRKYNSSVQIQKIICISERIWPVRSFFSSPLISMHDHFLPKYRMLYGNLE